MVFLDVAVDFVRNDLSEARSRKTTEWYLGWISDFTGIPSVVAWILPGTGD
jgi:hypothetical protein